LILRIVGQNGGGSRVYVQQVNRALKIKGKKVVTFYKEFKSGDPLTDPLEQAEDIRFGLGFFKLFMFAIRNKKKIDYIHSHLRNATVLSFVLSFVLGCKHVITVHGPIVYGDLSIKDKVIIWFFSIALKQASLVIFISEFTKESTLKLCAINNLKSSRVIYNGSDVLVSSNVLNKGKCDPIRVAIVGELTDRKQPLQLVKLCEYLPTNVLDKLEFNVYGEGYLKEQLKIGLEKWGQRVNLKGLVYNIDEIYGDADVHLIFSYDEGFGRVITEAMAYGVPSVAFNSGAFPEIINDGVTGFLFADIKQCSDIFCKIVTGKLPLGDENGAIQASFDEKFSNKVFESNTLKTLDEFLK